MPAPVSGEIVATNSAVADNPGLVNDDPYGAGWIVQLQPSDLEEDKAQLVTGQAAVDALEKLLEEKDISCQ